jgi:hypothetical protein
MHVDAEDGKKPIAAALSVGQLNRMETLLFCGIPGITKALFSESFQRLRVSRNQVVAAATWGFESPALRFI